MRIQVLTIFPELFAPFLATSLVGRAIARVEAAQVVGNLAVGVFAAAVWSAAPFATPALAVAPVACFMAYRVMAPASPLGDV